MKKPNPIREATPTGKQLRAWHADHFLAEAYASFKKNGRAAFEICFKEKPVEYLKIMLAILPPDDLTVAAQVKMIVTGVPRRGDEVTEVNKPQIEHQREH